MKPHKHAELIKAWADGATIERKWGNYVENNEPCWFVDDDPSWMIHVEYRIKPEPKPDINLYLKYYMDRPCIYPVNINQFPNLILRIDGETGELKSAGVLK